VSLRRSVARCIVPPLIAGTLALQVDGCAGTYRDSSSIGDPRGASGGPLMHVGPGSDLEITRRDGTLLHGRFRGTFRMSSEEYARHWSAFAFPDPADSIALPTPGARIEIRPREGRPFSARLVGFALGGIEFERDSAATETLAFVALNEVRTEHWSRTGTRLTWDSVRGALPLSTVLRLGVTNGEITLPADQVAEAKVRDSAGNYVAAGVLIAVVAAVAGCFLALYVIGHSLDSACAGVQNIAPASLDAALHADPAGSEPATSGGRPRTKSNPSLTSPRAPRPRRTPRARASRPSCSTACARRRGSRRAGRSRAFRTTSTAREGKRRTQR